MTPTADVRVRVGDGAMELGGPPETLAAFFQALAGGVLPVSVIREWVHALSGKGLPRLVAPAIGVDPAEESIRNPTGAPREEEMVRWVKHRRTAFTFEAMVAELMGIPETDMPSKLRQSRMEGGHVVRGATSLYTQAHRQWKAAKLLLQAEGWRLDVTRRSRSTPATFRVVPPIELSDR